MIARIYKLNDTDERESVIYETEVYSHKDMECIKNIKKMLEKETESRKYVLTATSEEISDCEWEIK